MPVRAEVLYALKQACNTEPLPSRTEPIVCCRRSPVMRGLKTLRQGFMDIFQDQEILWFLHLDSTVEISREA